MRCGSEKQRLWPEPRADDATPAVIPIQHYHNPTSKTADTIMASSEDDTSFQMMRWRRSVSISIISYFSSPGKNNSININYSHDSTVKDLARSLISVLAPASGQ